MGRDVAKKTQSLHYSTNTITTEVALPPKWRTTVLLQRWGLGAIMREEVVKLPQASHRTFVRRRFRNIVPSDRHDLVGPLVRSKLLTRVLRPLRSEEAPYVVLDTIQAGERYARGLAGVSTTPFEVGPEGFPPMGRWAGTAETSRNGKGVGRRSDRAEKPEP